ncbi:MAG: glutamine amidotransferase-related protein, partial [Acidocella sp.]
LRHATLPIYGVQFHPESIATSGGHQILGNFLRLARAAQPVAA